MIAVHALASSLIVILFPDKPMLLKYVAIEQAVDESGDV